MNQDETTVASTETEAVQENVVEETTADPIDAIEDINELRKVAKTHRSVAQRYKKDVKQPKPQTISDTQVPHKPYNILEDEVFDFINEGYSKEEIRFIQANGGRKSLENKDSLVAIAVKTKREQRQAEEASSQTSDKSGLSEVERKYTPEQMRNMKPEELEKLIGVVS